MLPVESIVSADYAAANAPSEPVGSMAERLRTWRDKGVATLAAAGLVLSLSACERGEPDHLSAGQTQPAAEQVAKPATPAEAPAETHEAPASATKTEKSILELRPGEMAKVSAALGWEGLADAQLSILDRYTTSQAEVVILSHEGAKPAAALIEEFRAALAIADRISSQHPQFKGYGWRLGPDTVRDVPFTLLPSKPGTDKPAQRYVVFTAQGASAKLQSPKAVAPGPVTAKSADKSIGITLLPDTPGQTPEGHNANEFNAFLEAFSLGSEATIAPDFLSGLEKLDLSSVANPTFPKPSLDEKKQLLTVTGRQMVAYSWGLARNNAKKGVAHGAYARQHAVPVRTEANTVGATCYNLPEATYPALSYRFDKP